MRGKGPMGRVVYVEWVRLIFTSPGGRPKSGPSLVFCSSGLYPPDHPGQHLGFFISPLYDLTGDLLASECRKSSCPLNNVRLVQRLDHIYIVATLFLGIRRHPKKEP